MFAADMLFLRVPLLLNVIFLCENFTFANPKKSVVKDKARRFCYEKLRGALSEVLSLFAVRNACSRITAADDIVSVEWNVDPNSRSSYSRIWRVYSYIGRRSDEVTRVERVG